MNIVNFTLSEHQKRMNKLYLSNLECLEDDLLNFEKHRESVRHDDFSGLLSSFLLSDIPYEDVT